MGLPKIIQIPCHHVLANQNALKLKKGASFKQFFNINLAIKIIKKLFFVHIFDISPMFLLKFWSRELIGCIIWVPTRHTFDGPRYPKTRNTWKNVMMTSSSHFSGIYFFWVAEPVKSMPSGYSLDAEFNSTSSGIYCFWGSRVRQKYAEWVLVGCGI